MESSWRSFNAMTVSDGWTSLGMVKKLRWPTRSAFGPMGESSTLSGSGMCSDPRRDHVFAALRVPQVAVLRDLCFVLRKSTGLRVRRPVAPDTITKQHKTVAALGPGVHCRAETGSRFP